VELVTNHVRHAATTGTEARIEYGTFLWRDVEGCPGEEIDNRERAPKKENRFRDVGVTGIRNDAPSTFSRAFSSRAFKIRFARCRIARCHARVNDEALG
jgi:hypothetical protein